MIVFLLVFVLIAPEKCISIDSIERKTFLYHDDASHPYYLREDILFAFLVKKQQQNA